MVTCLSRKALDLNALLFSYAGWMGTIAARYKEDGTLSDVVPSLQESSHRLAAVAGTSTCHIAQVSGGLPHLVQPSYNGEFRVRKVSSCRVFGVLTRCVGIIVQAILPS